MFFFPLTLDLPLEISLLRYDMAEWRGSHSFSPGAIKAIYYLEVWIYQSRGTYEYTHSQEKKCAFSAQTLQVITMSATAGAKNT